MTAQTEWVQSSLAADVSYPSAPWEMVGSLWLTLFRLREPVDDLRPAGVYGAAFVSYEDGSPLTYSELLVARPVSTDRDGRRVTITDIWVDSPASVAGGRELWAIPKGLCDFSFETSHRGPYSTTEWTARRGRTPIATAAFRDVSRAAPRLPFKGGTWQPGIEDTGGEDRTATLRGSSKALPARARWDINPDGAIGWLAGARQLASFRQASFRMSFG
jgi:acetoacetate decarboxylase